MMQTKKPGICRAFSLRGTDGISAQASGLARGLVGRAAAAPRLGRQPVELGLVDDLHRLDRARRLLVRAHRLADFATDAAVAQGLVGRVGPEDQACRSQAQPRALALQVDAITLRPGADGGGALKSLRYLARPALIDPLLP